MSDADKIEKLESDVSSLIIFCSELLDVLSTGEAIDGYHFKNLVRYLEEESEIN